MFFACCFDSIFFHVFPFSPAIFSAARRIATDALTGVSAYSSLFPYSFAYLSQSFVYGHVVQSFSYFGHSLVNSFSNSLQCRKIRHKIIALFFHWDKSPILIYVCRPVSVILTVIFRYNRQLFPVCIPVSYIPSV